MPGELQDVIQAVDAFCIQRPRKDEAFPVFHLTDLAGQCVQLLQIVRIVDVGMRNIAAKIADRAVNAGDLNAVWVDADSRKPCTSLLNFIRCSRQVEKDALLCAIDGKPQLCHTIPPIRKPCSCRYVSAGSSIISSSKLGVPWYEI